MVSTSTFFLHLLQPLFVAHAEALLLVDDQQAQVAELDVLRQQAVRADHDVHFAVRQISSSAALISFGDAEAAEHLDAHRERRRSAA